MSLEVVSLEWYLYPPRNRPAPSLLGCEETQSDGAYCKPSRSRTIALVASSKVPSLGRPDQPHFSPRPADGASPLLSRRLGRPARRTKTLAGARSIVMSAALPREGS